MAETLFTLENLWIAATCEHLHTWHLRMGENSRTCEEKLLKRISDENKVGPLKAETIVELAREFDVARGLPKLPDETSPKTDGVRLLRSFLEENCKPDFNGDFENKRIAFNKLVARLPKSNQTGKELKFVSGLSKFLWFMSPDDWTLFDSYAFSGLGDLKVSGKRGNLVAPKSASGKADAFYCKLSEINFPSAVSLIREKKFTGLIAERVVDKALWILGSKHHYKSVRDATSRLSETEKSTLNEKLAGTDPVALGRAISDELNGSDFNKHLSETWGLA